MPENVNTTPLSVISTNVEPVAPEDVAIEVQNVTMVFNMASEQLGSLKEYAIALARRQLHFKEFRALDGVSLTVGRGDVFGILGTNGSGKSTILKIIAGVLEPTKGSCRVNGHIAPLIELGAGFDMELTARENIFLNGSLLGYPKQFIAQHFDEIVEFAEIESFLDIPLKNYSSGMVARIAFAIATVIVPDILIVDEVLSVGDFMFQQKCERRIQTLIKEHGVTVLLVSHNNDQIERLCNKAIWIEKGHTRIIGTAKEVCAVYRLIGGCEGSPEAERTITEAFTGAAQPDGSLGQVISSDTKFGMAVELERSCPTAAANLVISPVATGIESYLCMGLLRGMDAFALLMAEDHIPDKSLVEIHRAHPHDALVLRLGEDTVAPAIRPQLEQADIAAIDFVEAPTFEELSVTLYRHAKAKGYYRGTTAVVAYREWTGDMTVLSRWLYGYQAPLFLENNHGELTAELDHLLRSGDFTHIIFLGDDNDFSPELLGSFEAAGITTDRITGDGPYNAAIAINHWIKHHDPEGIFQSSKAVICCPCWRLDNSPTIGRYAFEAKGCVFLEDPANLDSVAGLIRYVTEHADTVDSVVFIGDDTVYRGVDRDIILKALASAKRS